MRIISGKYKGRHFDIPRSFKARPTTDFAKENLFNILNNMVDFEEIKALDLFSGTGSISLELLSRGCQEVTSIEMDTLHFSFLKKSQATQKNNPNDGNIFMHKNVLCSISFILKKWKQF